MFFSYDCPTRTILKTPVQPDAVQASPSPNGLTNRGRNVIALIGLGLAVAAGGQRVAGVQAAGVAASTTTRPADAASLTSQPAPAATSAPLPVDAAQEKAFLQAAGEGFRIHRTAHFLVAHDTPPGVLQALSTRLEQTYDSVSKFCQRSGFPARPLSRRLEVIFFHQPTDYGRHAQGFGFNSKGTYGFYHDGTNRSVFFNVRNDPQLLEFRTSLDEARQEITQIQAEVKSLRNSRRAQVASEVQTTQRRIQSLTRRLEAYCDRINRTVVQHEVAHQTLYNLAVHAPRTANPKWLVEGLACMFETPPSTNGSGLGAVNQDRLKDFRGAVAGDPPQKFLNADTYAAAVAEGRMTSLSDLVQRPELFQERGGDGARHYAAAWGLVHFLHRTQNKALAEYLQAVAARKPGTTLKREQELALFEKHFGQLDSRFSARFSNYILSLPFRPNPDSLDAP